MSKNDYAYFAVWNMNGGPVPQSVYEALSEAVEGALAKVQTKEGDNVRLLWAGANNKSGELGVAE